MSKIIEQLQAHKGKVLKGPSPMGNWLKGTLEYAEEGTLRVSYTVRPEMTNPAGILHGGAVAAMLDEVMGMTVYSMGREAFYATVNLHTDFLGTAKEGEEVLVNTQIIRAGRTVIHIEAQLSNTSGKILARATSNLVSSQYGYKNS